MGKRSGQRLAIQEDGRRQQQLRRKFAGLVARTFFASALFLVIPVVALVATTVTIDGAFEDWAGVLASADNVVSDDAGDGLSGLNRDITQGAATADANNLYLLFRRASTTGGASWRFTAYVDCDGDNLLESTDRVVYYNFIGNGNYQSGGVAQYVPVVPAGDSLVGGAPPPGSIGANVPNAQYAARIDPTIIVAEGRVNWAALGVPADRPVNVLLGCGATNGTLADATNVVSLRRRSVTLVEPQATAATAGTTVSLAHTLTNTGNDIDVYDLSAISELGWSTVIKSGGASITAATLSPGQSITLSLEVEVPALIADGVKDSIELVASNASDPDVQARITDRISVGQLLVIPDDAGKMAAGSTIVYRATVQNNSSIARSITASATSSLKWTTSLLEADGVTPLGTFNLAAYTSRPVVISVSVPTTESAGTQNVTSVRASVITDAAMYGQGTFVTTVGSPIEVSPSRSQYAGPDSYSYFRQAVSNSWPTTRTIALAATSSRGWPVACFADDGVTPLTSVTVGPNGATRFIRVRVSIPNNAMPGWVDAITTTASQGSHSATCVSTVVIANLATFDSGGFSSTQDTFALGSTVYARSMGFAPGTSVNINWTDPNGTVTSYTRQADALGAANSAYPLSATSAVGTWTVDVSTGGTLTQSVSFKVVYNGAITRLVASDAASAGSTFTVGSRVRNGGPGTIPATTLDYLVWWDSNGNGRLDSGDLYVGSNGSTQVHSGDVSPTTKTAVCQTLIPNASFNDAWSMSNTGLTRGGVWYVTLTWRDGANVVGTQTTTFYSAMSALSVTVSSGSADLGNVYPDDSAVLPITVTVNSDQTYDLTTSYVNQADLGLTSALGPRLNQPAGQSSFSDTVGVLVPWTKQGPVTAGVVYTVVLK